MAIKTTSFELPPNHDDHPHAENHACDVAKVKKAQTPPDCCGASEIKLLTPLKPKAVAHHEHHHHAEHDHAHEHSHGHAHGHEHAGGEFNLRKISEIGIAAVLFLTGIFFNEALHNTPFAIAEYAVFITAYLLVGRSVVWSAFRNLLRGRVFDENFLMTLATVGAISIHLLPEAVAVMLFYSVGEYFQERAINRSRRSIKALLDIRPDSANVERNGQISEVSPEEVAIGELILVKPGERVPLDGEVVEGVSFVDTSALTGESVPRSVRAGESVLAGMINTQGLIKVKVTRSFGESSVTKILELVEKAANRKAPTEAFITTFSRYYTPAVVIIALGVALLPDSL
jgi:Zn2+/Cd2+-exporting ATPase